MANRNPDIIEGNGRRQIAAHYYPEIGPYASADESVIEYQLNLMKYAGVDGIFVSKIQKIKKSSKLKKSKPENYEVRKFENPITESLTFFRLTGRAQPPHLTTHETKTIPKQLSESPNESD
jgi:hypothetical protein